ncbi:GHKL domain-containing protein (plasmid) [Pseudalkalibacillus hwajinpoensis]|uniref:sensor histidine kinase n=1 Tax=Guptibacillus hwajinpoensis TaxID=208199 RepID=UPI00325A9AA0
MDYLLKILGIFLEFFAILFFCTAFLSINIKKNYRNEFLAIWLLGSTVIFLFQSFITVPPYINFSVSLSILLLLISTLMKVRVLISLAIVVLSSCLFIFFEFVSLSILDNFFDVYLILEQTSLARVLISLPHICALVLISTFFYVFRISFIPWKIIHSEKLDKHNKKHFHKYITFLFINLAFIIIMVFTVSYSEFYLGIESKGAFFVIILCTTYLLFFSQQLLKEETKRLEQHLDEQYQEDVNKYFRLIKSQRHDFVHHLNTLYGLILQDNTQATREYISELIEDVRTTNESLPLSHPAMSALLLTLKQKASMNGIDMSIIINSPFESLPCRISEISRVIGNLIDNAIEELTPLPQEEKWIEVILDADGTDYTILVSNCGKIEESISQSIFDYNFTTKDGDHQGLGLPETKRIVESYNGLIYLEIDEGYTSFFVSLPISA